MPGLARRIADAGVEHVVLLTSRCVVGRPARQRDHAHVAGLRGGGARVGRRLDDPAAQRLPVQRAALAAAAAPGRRRARPVARRPGRGDRSGRHRRGRRHRAHRAGPRRTPRTPERPGAADARRPDRDPRPRCSGARCATSRSPTSEARAEMAPDTPAPYIDAFFRFYSDGEFDDAPVLDTVRAVTGRAPRPLRAVGAAATPARSHSAAGVSRHPPRRRGRAAARGPRAGRSRPLCRRRP